MEYQLVIRFSSENIDRLHEAEDKLAHGMAALAEVDGHDIGAGEMNIFLFTAGPVEALKRIREILGDSLPSGWKAAYRPVEEENYIVLWPEGCTEFDIA